jgi:hypothetical protein
MPMTDPGALAIQTMRADELDLALDWAAAEGWNPGQADAACFRAADRHGFLVALENGAPVGSISVVRYADRFGFLGLYIVRSDRRGRGFGLRVWEAGMVYLDGCTVGLDGVVAQQANYARSGFALAHRTIRYGGSPAIDGGCDARVVPVTSDILPAVLAYDRRMFPAPREAFLRCWLDPIRRKALALLIQGSVHGYGVIRACRTGFKIGPLFAADAEGAGALFRAFLNEAGGGPVFIDVPEPNQAGLALARRHGLEPVFETARMYRGSPPELPLHEIFGITTLELG